MNKLSIKACTLAVAITWSLSMLLLAWISAFGWGVRDVNVIAGLYIGYDASFWGGIIGAIWGFIDGAIGGFVFSYLYNFFMPKH